MSEEQTEGKGAAQNAADEKRAAAAARAAEEEERTRPERADWSHEDAVVDEWEDESFPASDPPAP